MTKPDWLLQQVSFLEQRQEAITRHIAQMDTAIKDHPGQTPAHVLTSRSRAQSDLHEVQQQLSVLTLGWEAINTAP